jgi:hypothetical protein
MMQRELLQGLVAFPDGANAKGRLDPDGGQRLTADADILKIGTLRRVQRLRCRMSDDDYI